MRIEIKENPKIKVTRDIPNNSWFYYLINPCTLYYKEKDNKYYYLDSAGCPHIRLISQPSKYFGDADNYGNEFVVIDPSNITITLKF